MICVEEELLKLTTDYVFKRVIGDPSDETALMFIIQTISKIDVKNFEFLPQEVPREDPDLKTVIYDIAARINRPSAEEGDGTRVNLEMQQNFHKSLIDRMFYYGTKLITLKKGNDYHKLNKAIVITFVNDSHHFFPHPVSVYVQGEWKSNPNHILTDALVYYFIALNRIDEIAETEETKDLILVLQFLTCKRREEMEALAQKNENLKQASETLIQISQDPNERAIAISRDKFLWDQEARERGAREEGIEIGKEEGIKEGIKEGIEIGKEEGILQTAKAMLVEGIPMETVCKITGLRPEDLA